jgi:hypothetical protein
VRFVRILTPLPRDRERIAGTIQPDDCSFGSDELANHPGDVPKSRPQVEHSDASCEAGCLQEQPRRGCDRGRLSIETGQFVRVVAEHVAATMKGFRHHRGV